MADTQLIQVLISAAVFVISMNNSLQTRLVSTNNSQPLYQYFSWLLSSPAVSQQAHQKS